MLHDRLVESGILPESAAMEDEEVSLDIRSYVRRGLPNVATSESSVDPDLAVKMKEMDLWIKQVKHETLLVKLHIIEVKTDQALKLWQLELNDLDLKNWPMPKVRSRPPSVCSPAAVPSEFEWGWCRCELWC